MNSYIFKTLVILLLCMQYIYAKKVHKIKSNVINTTVKTSEVSAISTSYKFPTVQIPLNYHLDSVVVYDSVSRAEFVSYFIQSKQVEMKQFNQVVLQMISELIIAEQKYVDPYNEDDYCEIAYDYRLRPVEIYTNSNIISIYNIIDTYAIGGNHHNYTMYTINYDLNTNKQIEFNDVFNLQNHADSAEFITFAEEYTLNNGCDQWGWSFDYLDFSFNDNGVNINPNLSWACLLTRSLLPINAENKFIRKEWVRHIFPSKK